MTTTQDKITPTLFTRFNDTIKNKPFKKVYRVVLLALLLFIINNTSSNSTGIIDMMNKALKENFCNATVLNV